MVTERSKNTNKVKQGKKNRKSGSDFERKVREDLESKGWIVDRWGNNVEFEEIKQEGIGDFRDDALPVTMCPPIIKGKLISAKAKYNPFTKSIMMRNSGFPDFIALTRTDSNETWPIKNEDGTFYLSGVRCWIGVEAKSNGILDKEEKEKCKWLLENNIFSKILIAKKKKERRKIIVEYVEFQE